MDIEILNLKTDIGNNGFLVEFLTEKDVKKNGGFGHMFFVNFKSLNSVRGNHYHVKQHEYFAVPYGKVKVVLEDIKTKKRKTVILSSEKKNFQMLRVGPNIAHAVISMSKGSILLGYYKYPHIQNKLDTKEYKLI